MSLCSIAETFSASPAFSQSSPGFSPQQTLTAAGLNGAFVAKQDYLGSGTTGNILTWSGSAPVWGPPSAVGVSTFSGGTTGLTPGSPSTGAVALGGVLSVANGGTGSATQNFVDLTTTQNVAGAKTFTTQLIGKGTATNDNACAGCIGEYVCAQVTNGGSPSGCSSNVSTPVTLTTATVANVTSESLTAGDWEVCGNINFLPAGTTTVSQLAGGISETSATLPGDNLGGGASFSLVTTFSTGSQQSLPAGCKRESFSATTPVYLVSLAAFGASTMRTYGFIWARRVR